MLIKRSSTLVSIFIVYFSVHAFIRTTLGWSLSPQEIEIIENAQRFAWLYDGQMPLYIWLQSAVFNTFGPTLLSLTMMKNALMLMICLSIYTLVQRVSNTTYALATTLSLVFIPQLVWTSQHSLTTPVLATLFAATTLLAFSRLSVEKSVPRYGILGAMIGFGAISTVTFLLVPVALLMAAITSRSHRNIVFNSGFIAAIMIAGSIAGWPYYQLFLSGQIVVPDLANVNPLHWDIFVDRARGMYSALQTALTFSSLLIVGAAITVYSGLGRNIAVNEGTKALRELMLRTVSFGLILIFGIAFLSGGVWMNQSTLQPLLFLVAPVLALYLFPAMSTRTHRNAITVGSVIALAVLIITPAHYTFGSQFSEPERYASSEPDYATYR